MPSIFLSYRRNDAPGHAGRVYDRLVDRFGAPNVFKDLDSLEPGADFAEVIEATLARCDALVAVVGPDWLLAGRDGHRRLDEPGDWVRLEIASALKRRIRVIPVLVHGATMPEPGQLPEDIRLLARRHAIVLSETTWSAQIQQLIDVLAEPPPRTRSAAGPTLPRPLRGEPGSFVGRTAALSELMGRFDLAAAGAQQFVLVSGEAGIGKTRLVAEVTQRLQAAHARVLYGRSDPESLVPYQPFVTAIQRLLAEHPVLPRELAPELRELARFVPALRSRLPDPGEPLAEEPETRRYMLFEAVRRVLAFVAGDAPTVLVLDDLHWADSSTALLLAHVWRDPEPTRLLVLATLREPGEAPCAELSDFLDRVRGDAGFAQLALAGFDADETSALIESAGTGEADEPFARRLLERTNGNPFFIIETLRSLEGGAEPDAVPEGVKGLIAGRLRALSETARRTLTLASAVGPEFRLAVIEALLDEPGDRTLVALEQTIGAGLVREATDDVDRFLFSHALIREALYEQLSAARRARLHLAIAEALERLGGEPAELARHFLASRQLDRDGKAVTYCVRAAEQAQTALAYEDAAGHYGRALESGRVPDERGRCELLLGLARARSGSGHAATRETFVEAAAIARREGMHELLAQAALGLANPLGFSVDAEAVALLEEALLRLGERDDPLVVRVRAALANNLHFERRDPRDELLSASALEMARRIDDDESLIAALQSRRKALSDVAHLQERLRVGEELLALAARRGARELEAYGLFDCIYDRVEAADMEGAQRLRARLCELADELHQPLYRAWAATWNVVLCERLPEIEGLAAEAHALGKRAHSHYADPFFAYQLVALRFRQDRLHELTPLIAAQAEQNPQIAVLRPVLTLAYLRAGQHDAALAEFEAAARANFEGVPHDEIWLGATCLLADACAVIGDATRARVLYERIAPYRHLNVQLPMVCCFGSVERFLGLLAATFGDPATASSHYDAAVAANDARGLTIPATIARFEYAELLLAGDHERAQALLSEVVSGAEATGLVHLAVRARALQP